MMGDPNQAESRIATRCAEDIAEGSEPPTCEELRVRIGYSMPADRAGFKADFGQGRVSPMFYSGRKWSKVYVGTSLRVGAYHAGPWGEPGVKRILLAHFGRWIEAEDVIRAAWRIPCRIACHVELYAFAKALPEMGLRFPIAALGSSVRDSGRSCVAILSEHAGVSRLACEDLTMPWPMDTRFMLVGD